MLFDLGILYLVGVNDLRVGFAVRNFGPDLRPGGDPPVREGYAQQGEFQAFRRRHRGCVRRGLHLGLRRPRAPADDHRLQPSERRPRELPHGRELDLLGKLFVRGGWETGRDAGGVSAGFGLQLKRKQMLWRIDYGYRDMGAFGDMHFVSLELSPLWSKERRQHGRAGR